MARSLDENEGLTVLDRLLWQPDRVVEAGPRGDPFLHSIAMNLETLLSSRRSGSVIPEEYPEVAQSIANFGLPALSRYGDIGTATEQNRLCRAIEDAVKTFEPRLKRAQARIPEIAGKKNAVVRLRLSAEIAGYAEREVFELRLKPETGEMTVSAEQ